MPGALGRRGTALLHRLAGAEPARALALVGKARRLRPGSPFLAQAEAILVARARGWAAAEPLFSAPAARRAPDAAAGLLRDRPAPAAGLALPARERPADLDPATAARLVVYTTAFGAEPDPVPILAPPAGLRFVCLTDRPLDAAGWEALLPPRGAPADPATRRRLVPHPPGPRAGRGGAGGRGLALSRVPTAGWSATSHTLLLRWCLAARARALAPPGTAIDWQDLAEARLIPGASAPAAVLAQARGLRGARAAARPRRLGRRHDLAPAHAGRWRR